MHERRKVEQNEEVGNVYIDDVIINGWVIKDETCLVCGERIVFDFDNDAKLCPQCNKWLEPQCGDHYCKYCNGRPGKPLNRKSDNWKRKKSKKQSK